MSGEERGGVGRGGDELIFRSRSSLYRDDLPTIKAYLTPNPLHGQLEDLGLNLLHINR